MHTKKAKQAVTIAALISYLILLVSMQPAFFGVVTYFGVNAIFIIMPIAFPCIVLFILHVYQNWALMLHLFKKSADRTKQRERIQRLVVLLAFMLILGYDIVLAWYEALRFGIYEMNMESIRIWSWVSTGLIAIHVWQRWRLTLSYFKNIF